MSRTSRSRRVVAAIGLAAMASTTIASNASAFGGFGGHSFGGGGFGGGGFGGGFGAHSFGGGGGFGGGMASHPMSTMPHVASEPHFATPMHFATPTHFSGPAHVSTFHPAFAHQLTQKAHFTGQKHFTGPTLPPTITTTGITVKPPLAGKAPITGIVLKQPPVINPGKLPTIGIVLKPPGLKLPPGLQLPPKLPPIKPIPIGIIIHPKPLPLPLPLPLPIPIPIGVPDPIPVPVPVPLLPAPVPVPVPVTTAVVLPAPVPVATQVAALPAPVAPVAVPTCGLVRSDLSVTFQPAITAADIATFVKSFDVAMADGPNPDGIYRIRLQQPNLTQAQIDQTIASMQAQTTYVASVTPQPAAALPTTRSACGTYVSVNFVPTIHTGDVTAFLKAYNVTMSDGTKPDGSYTIRLSEQSLAKADVDAIVASMRTQTAFVSAVDRL